MAKKLFVGNLSWNTTDQSLQDFFAAFGTVILAHVITDRTTGRSRGFGFVEYGTDEEAQKAVAEASGKSLDGRDDIVVNEAREREDRGPRQFGGGSGGYNKGGGYGDRGGRNDRRNSY